MLKTKRYEITISIDDDHDPNDRRCGGFSADFDRQLKWLLDLRADGIATTIHIWYPCKVAGVVVEEI